MGLCKCPKRKTTSHFCFHHCVNVCEHCIVNNHTICVVKSYTTWLKEASGSISSSSVTASALCTVCQRKFVSRPKEVENLTTNVKGSNSSTKTPIRLLCYHVVHAHCLSVYVKKQLKEGNTLKCPSCARHLWLQQQQVPSHDINNIIEDESNELSPVALHLYKHLMDNGNWWGQAVITNGNVNNIEKYLLEDKDDYEEFTDEESDQLFEGQQAIEIKPQFNSVPNNISPLTVVQSVPLPNSNSNYFSSNSSESAYATLDKINMNHLSSTHQTYQPVHHRQFNNNYGIDSEFTPHHQSVNMTITQGSDLSNRHTITSSTPLLLNNDNDLNHYEEQQDPSGKYRPKKFNIQSRVFNYQRLQQYFCGTNRVEDYSTARITTVIFLCVIIIVVILVAITSYTRSNNDPFDNNSVDYGGGNGLINNGGEAEH